MLSRLLRLFVSFFFLEESPLTYSKGQIRIEKKIVVGNTGSLASLAIGLENAHAYEPTTIHVSAHLS